MKRNKMLNKSKSAIILFILVSAFLLTLPVFSMQLDIPFLVADVKTDVVNATYREMVNIYGNVTFEGSLVKEGLVGIQVRNPVGTTLALRTVAANETIPSEGYTVEITSFMPTDSNGDPRSMFNKESNAFFSATMRNNNIFSPKDVLFTITLCDSDSTPFKIYWVITTISPDATHSVLVALYIDDWVSTGNATAYANVYTTWPKNGGYPYAPEKTATFCIETTRSRTPDPPDVSYSSYWVPFRLPPSAIVGEYTVSVSAYYTGGWEDATDEVTFVRVFQLDADLIFDHEIDIFDVVVVTGAYGSQGAEADWTPVADITPNGIVDIFDVVVVTGVYGTTY